MVGLTSNEAHCARCDRTFVSEEAFQQHRDDSPRHFYCEVCGFDASTWEKSLKHHRKTAHRVVCMGCNDGEGATWVAESQAYFDHLEEDNVCKDCEEHFESPSNLHHHETTHLSRSIECYGCPRKFPTYPAMIIHLESGACSSKIDIVDLNESAAECFQWRAYLAEDYRNELLNREDLQDVYYDPVSPFKCPECDVVFAKLSGLFQHVYSPACDQTLEKGKIAKLAKWLEKRHCVDGEQ